MDKRFGFGAHMWFSPWLENSVRQKHYAKIIRSGIDVNTVDSVSLRAIALANLLDFPGELVLHGACSRGDRGTERPAAFPLWFAQLGASGVNRIGKKLLP
jgi:hypothetical protein